MTKRGASRSPSRSAGEEPAPTPEEGTGTPAASEARGPAGASAAHARRDGRRKAPAAGGATTAGARKAANTPRRGAADGGAESGGGSAGSAAEPAASASDPPPASGQTGGSAAADAATGGGSTGGAGGASGGGGAGGASGAGDGPGRGGRGPRPRLGLATAAAAATLALGAVGFGWYLSPRWGLAFAALYLLGIGTVAVWRAWPQLSVPARFTVLVLAAILAAIGLVAVVPGDHSAVSVNAVVLLSLVVASLAAIAWLFWSQLPPWGRVGVRTVGVAIAVVAFVAALAPVLALVRASLSGGWPAEARIYVEPPQVYTRERLVNDRYREMDWLQERLERMEPTRDAAPSMRRGTTERSDLLLGADGDTSDAATADARPAEGLQLDPTSAFNIDLQNRLAVRSEMMNALLDDTHDLQGATLYRLNFDVSIVPREGASGFGVVAIDLMPPGACPPPEDGDGDAARCGPQRVSDIAEQIRDHRDLLADWGVELQDFVSTTFRDRLQVLREQGDPFRGDVKEGVAFDWYLKARLVDVVYGILAGPRDLEGCTVADTDFHCDFRKRFALVKRALFPHGSVDELPGDLSHLGELIFADLSRSAEARQDQREARRQAEAAATAAAQLLSDVASATGRLWAHAERPGEGGNRPRSVGLEACVRLDGEAARPEPAAGVDAALVCSLKQIGFHEPARGAWADCLQRITGRDAGALEGRCLSAARALLSRRPGRPCAEGGFTIESADGNFVEQIVCPVVPDPPASIKAVRLASEYRAIFDHFLRHRAFAHPALALYRDVDNLDRDGLATRIQSEIGLNWRLLQACRAGERSRDARGDVTTDSIDGLIGALWALYGDGSDLPADTSALPREKRNWPLDRELAAIYLARAGEDGWSDPEAARADPALRRAVGKAVGDLAEACAKPLATVEGRDDVALFERWYAEFFIDRLRRNDIPGFRPYPPIDRFFEVTTSGCLVGSCSVGAARKDWLARADLTAAADIMASLLAARGIAAPVADAAGGPSSAAERVGDAFESLLAAPDEPGRTAPTARAVLKAVLPETADRCLSDARTLDVCRAAIHAGVAGAIHVRPPTLLHGEVVAPGARFRAAVLRSLRGERDPDRDPERGATAERVRARVAALGRLSSWEEDLASGVVQDFVETVTAYGLKRHLERLGNDITIYGVEPRLRSLVDEVTIERSRQLKLDLERLQATGAAISAARRAADLLERIDARPTVIGFGHLRHPTTGALAAAGVTPEPDRASFGWVFLPNHVSPNRFTGGLEDSHRATTYRVSALVSVPSWWSGLSLTVRQCWGWYGHLSEAVRTRPYDEAERCHGGRPSAGFAPAGRARYRVDLPAITGRITEVFDFEVVRVPYIRADSPPQEVEAGRAGEIIIEGERLWRGTVVFLGRQMADSIKVLPDMKGVKATFRCIHPPPGLRHFTNHGRTERAGGPDKADNKLDNMTARERLLVWTAQGSASTAVRITPYRQRLPEERPCWLDETERGRTAEVIAAEARREAIAADVRETLTAEMDEARASDREALEAAVAAAVARALAAAADGGEGDGGGSGDGHGAASRR